MKHVRRFLVPALAVAVVALAASKFFAQTVDPFDDQNKRTNTDVPFVLPDALPNFAGDRTLARLLEILDLKASAKPAQVKRGEIARITIDGTTVPYAYTYSATKRHELQVGEAPKFRYEQAPWLTPLYPIVETEAKLKGTGEDSAYVLRDKFQWQQDVYVTPTAPVGKHVVNVLVNIQVCENPEGNPLKRKVCLRSTDFRPLPITLEIVEGDPAPPPADLSKRTSPPDLGGKKVDSVSPGTPTPPVSSTPGGFQDLGGLLLGGFVGAILMLLTPCVFPMIPITVNFFIKQSEKEHHRPYFMASVYAGTIVVLLTCVILLVGKSIIDLANNAWFNLGLGVVLVVFALGLFGMFEVDLTKFFGTVLLVCVGFGISLLGRWIPGADKHEFAVAAGSLLLSIPATMLLGRGLRAVESMLGFEESAVLNFLSLQESKGGALGATFMAMTFTITSFSCTGPFLGILLAPLAGTNIPKWHLLLAALVYSATFAAPFFLLALFPTYLKKLPRSGGWMTTIKVTMGFLEIGAALKFLSIADLFWFPGNPRIFNHDTVLCSWIALSIACGLYLFGLFRLHHDSVEDHIGVPRMLFACVFLGMGLYLTPLLFGFTPRGVVMEAAVAFLPPDFEKAESIPWIKHDYEEAWKKAVAEKKLIFVDFTGVNCTNCRTNERNVFSRSDVTAELKKYVCVKLYTDFVPDTKLSPSESKIAADLNFRRQVALIDDISQPSYVILDPKPVPFHDGKLIDATVAGYRTGEIFDIPDFVRFLDAPLKGRNEKGQTVP